MMWTRHLMRTDFVFLVTMSMLANESEANIRAEWTQINDGQAMGEVRVLETDGFRLYAGLIHQGVSMYANHFNEWVHAGLYGKTVDKLVSHKYYLYAVAGLIGIYRGSMVSVQPYGKLAATWGTIKTK